MDASRRVIDFVLGNKDTSWRDLEDLGEDDIARSPQRFVGGRNSWIAQSYVRLRPALEAAGWTVRASSRFRPGAIAVVHRDDANRFASDAHASFLVVVRADRAPVVACDFALAQNALALASKERFLPLWPQPGLRPRDACRGARVSRIAYVGRTGSAPPWFHDREFLRALRFRGVEFEVKRVGWDDYSGVDVAVAARIATPAQLRNKPATKLYNAWLAGVPMVASPEPAYAELRRSPIDFIEAAGPRDVLAAVDLLRANPGLYAAMIANGRMRGREFGVGAVRARWLELLEGEVAPAFDAARARLEGRRGWYLSAMAAQKARSRLHRMRVGFERCLRLTAQRRLEERRAALLERPADHFRHVPR
jgi:hypothetical protein